MTKEEKFHSKFPNVANPKCSVNALAYIFGDVTDRYVQELAQRGVITKAARGKYEIIPAVIDYIKHIKAFSSNKGGQDDDLRKEKVRLTRSMADKTELEVSILKGQVIPEETVSNVWGTMISAFRARVIGIPTKLSPQLVGINDVKEIEALLRETVNEALSELAEYDGEQYINRKDNKKGGKARSTAANTNP